MKKPTCILFCFLLVSAVSVVAQSGKARRSSLGISIGKQQVRFQDDLASPLRYEAKSSPFVGLNYTHNTLRSFFKVNLSGGMGAANPERFGARDYLVRWSDKDSFQYQISSMYANVNLEATYLRKLNPASTGALGYWAGGTLNNSAYYADEVANFPWMNNAAELSPSFKMGYQGNSRHNFSVKIDLAGIALFTRTVYGLFPKSNKDNNVTSYLKQGTRLTSMHQYQKVNVEFNYGYHLSNRLSLGGTYDFKWLHYSYPRALRAVDNRFYVNIDYSLHK